MDAYFEEKKRKGYILTAKHINPSYGDYCMIPIDTICVPIEQDGPSSWSHLSGRYRTYEEQCEFMRSGRKDKKLPPIE